MKPNASGRSTTSSSADPIRSGEEGDSKSRFSPSLQVRAVSESSGLTAHRDVQRAFDFAVKGTGRETPDDAFWAFSR